MSDADLELRRKLRLAARGLVPDQHLDEVVDLAMHAVSCSFTAVADVVKRASIPPVAISATSIALSVILAEASTKLEGLQTMAAACGMTCTVTHVSVGGQGNG